MAKDELEAFRKRWEQELKSKKEEQRPVGDNPSSRDVPGQSGQREVKNKYFVEDLKRTPSKATPEPEEDKGWARGRREAEASAEPDTQPGYVSIASSLLDGRTSPLRDRIQEERRRRKRQYHHLTGDSASLQQEHPQRKVKKDESLLDRLIQDLVCG